MRTWTKSAAAVEQLDAAIALFAEDKIISAHSLAGACSELARGVAKAKGIATHAARLDALITANAPHRAKEIHTTLRRPQNFAKHADRDPHDEIDVNPKLTELMIFRTILDVGLAFNHEETIRQALYRGWFATRNPSAILEKDIVYLDAMQELFGELQDHVHEDAVAVLRQHLQGMDEPDVVDFYRKIKRGKAFDWSQSMR